MARPPRVVISDAGGSAQGHADAAPSAPPAAIVDAGSDAASDTSGAAARRVETNLYDVEFEGIRKCSLAESSATRTSFVGAAVRTRARVSEMFITPQDFTLEQGGVIVSARHVNPPALAQCLPLLLAKQLRAGQSVRGFVLFEMPARFRASTAPVILAYRPTRWGGAPRVEFPIAPCLDVCTDTVTVEKKAKTVGGRSRARRSER